MNRAKQFTGITVCCCLAFSPAAALSATKTILSESFADCALPTGWALKKLGGNCNWTFDSNRQNETGGEGCFAIADSDACGQNTSMDVAIVMPPLDCSNLTGTMLSFKHYLYAEKDNTIFSVEISIDSGVTWTAAWRQQGKINQSNQTASINLSAAADGRSLVLLRFRYSAAYDWWWQIDDVTVSANEGKKSHWLLFLPAIIGHTQK